MNKKTKTVVIAIINANMNIKQIVCDAVIEMFSVIYDDTLICPQLTRKIFKAN